MYGYWIRWQAFLNTCLYSPITIFILSKFRKRKTPCSFDLASMELELNAYLRSVSGLSSESLKDQSNLDQRATCEGRRTTSRRPKRCRRGKRSRRARRSSGRRRCSTTYRSHPSNAFRWDAHPRKPYRPR